MTNVTTNLRTILVPMDLSHGSVKALNYAVDRAREVRATVVLLHAVRLNIAGEEIGIPRTRLLCEMAEQARSQFRRLTDGLSDGNVPTRIVIVEGRPDVEILDQARKAHADLIVMGAHRHRTPFHFLHPNTIQHVFEHAHCPVVVVGPEEQEAQ